MSNAVARAARAHGLAWGLLLLVPVLLLPPAWRHAEDRGWCLVRPGACRDNETYAARFFEGLLPVEDVLASRQWPIGASLLHRRFAPYDCTYAVVTLRTDLPALPPTRDDGVGDLHFDWGVRGEDWTRMSDAFRFRRNDPGRVVELCEPYWDTRTAAALGTAAANPSAWIAERWDGTLFLYSPDRRVAARIRFGD